MAECADKVRLACKHAVLVKRSGTSLLNKGLRELCDLVEREARDSPEAPHSRQSRVNTTTYSSVIICGVSCQCTACKVGRCRRSGRRLLLCLSRSPTSLGAEACRASVEAKRGGHKKQVLHALIQKKLSGDVGLQHAERTWKRPSSASGGTGSALKLVKRWGANNRRL